MMVFVKDPYYYNTRFRTRYDRCYIRYENWMYKWVSRDGLKQKSKHETIIDAMLELS